MKSITIPVPAIHSDFPLGLSVQPSNSNENSTCEDGNISERSHRGSIRKLSTSRWPTNDVHASENDQLLMHQEKSSVESRLYSTWTEEKENV